MTFLNTITMSKAHKTKEGSLFGADAMPQHPIKVSHCCLQIGRIHCLTPTTLGGEVLPPWSMDPAPLALLPPAELCGPCLPQESFLLKLNSELLFSNGNMETRSTPS